jgi:DNA polymerase-3 subunit gamma/tau
LLADIRGQSITTSIISRQLADNKLPKVYIFVGGNGRGKTSLARIIANELGVENPVEINAAVTNSVDDIRALNEDDNYLSFDGKMKVYIVDECSHITKQGWMAALKLLEEPPENVLFIFCTTELQKLPPAILSRAQVFYLQPVSTEEMVEQLGIICNDQDLDFEPEALTYIAKGCMGSMREAIQKLDQVSILGNITLEAVKKVLPDLDLFYDILINKRTDRISELANNSVSIDSLVKEALVLANGGNFPRKIAIGLVKLRPLLSTPFDPEVIRCFLDGAFEMEGKNG